MKLVYAEKPSVGKEYARILGASKSYEGYMEGNDWVVTWGFGHLIELEEPDFYLAEELKGKWRKEQLPIVPEEFVFRVKNDSGVKKQLNIIKNLARRSDIDTIVNGTDAGREGEAIFRYVFNYLGVKKRVQRLWTSSLTDEALQKAFNDLKESSEFDSMYEAALCRNEADWLVGMNASRSISIATSKPLSLGRVQTPTLAMICKRYTDNKTFVSKPYFIIKVVLNTPNNSTIVVNIPEQFDDKAKAEAYLNNIPTEWTISDKKEEEISEKAPLPFDITSLQVEANKRYGMKAEKTLNTVQSLYQSKMVTYPRTGSRYLAEDMVTPVGEGVSKLAELNYSEKFNEACKALNPQNINQASFNTSKLTDHHAIIPTFINLRNEIDEFSHIEKEKGVSNEDCKHIYDLIVKQLVMSLLPKCVKNKLTYEFNVNGNKLHVSGFTIKSEGWRCIKDEYKEEDSEDSEDNQKLPNLEIGDVCEVGQKSVLDKKTKADPLLTEATLLKLMEGAGKLLDEENKDLREAIKECGLGTPATRAAAIETLFEKKYVSLEGKKLVPTELGLHLYEIIKHEDIAKVELTAEWENKLQQIDDGKYSASAFIDEIEEYTQELTDTLIQINGEEFRNNAAKVVAKCPLCGGNVVEKDKSYSCVNHKKGEESTCEFWINKTFSGVPLKKKDCLKLINLEISSEYMLPLKDGTKKAKKLQYNLEQKRVTFVAPTRIETSITCPKCGGKIIETEKQYKCENNNYLQEGSCPISIFKDTKMGLTLTEKMVETLLTGKKLEKVKLTAKNGTKYEGTLYYDFEKNGVIRYSEQKETNLVCPKCGGKIIETDRMFKCENYLYGNDDSCQLAIFKEQGTTFDEGIIKILLEGGKTDFIELIGKNGKYKARLSYNSDENKIIKEYPPKQTKETTCKCPVCGCKILETENGYNCEKYKFNVKGSCSFSIYKNPGILITEDLLKILVSGEQTDLLELKKKDGSTYKAYLRYDKSKNEIVKEWPKKK